MFQQNDHLRLLCAGGGKFSKQEQILLETLGLQKFIIQMNLDDEELFYAYQNALCFVFPSLYEGFGLPILEAFTYSCPAVLSDSSSLPEIGRDAAVYFDPNDKTSIYNAIQKVILDENLSTEMKKKGKLQLQKFSWDNCADETLTVYKNLITL